MQTNRDIQTYQIYRCSCAPFVADEPKIINIAPPTLKFLKPVANRTRREETCLKITYVSHFQMLEVPVTMKIHMNFISYHYT